MFNIGDYVVYKRDVCVVTGYREKLIKDIDYYTLVPVMDDTLKIDVPINCGNIREVIDKDSANKIIDNIVNVGVIDVNDKLIENEYKRLLSVGGYDELISIIKTTYLRNSDRVSNKKRISEKDNNYFNLAEKYLYSEFAIALGMSYDEVKDYIINRVSDISKSNK